MNQKQKIVVIIFVAVFVLLLIILFINNSADYSDGVAISDVNETSKEINVDATNTSTECQNEQIEEILSDSIISICKAIIPDTIPQQLLIRKAYIVSYNSKTMLPNWVAWHLTANHTDGPFSRCGNFHEDEDISVPRATLEDYKGSGWSRGHMCPAGDNKWDEQAMFETFALSNVCPQNASLNSGLWNSIEIDCRRWANTFGDIYIVCGPLYLSQEHKTIGGNMLVVPEAFFKVVLCLNGTPKAFGFIVRNTDGNSKRDLYYNSVDQVERITGYNFFSALPDDIENIVEANADIQDWKR